MPVEQTLGPRVDSLAERISQACAAASRKRDTKGVVEASQCRLALLVSGFHNTAGLREWHRDGVPAEKPFFLSLVRSSIARQIHWEGCHRDFWVAETSSGRNQP